MEVVGTIKFDNRIINVYGSLDEPLFRVRELANALGYSDGNTWNMAQMCEQDEVLSLQSVVAGQRRMMRYVTEGGLYNILSQSRLDTARKWRRIIIQELIKLRKERGLNITEQFEEWDHEADTIYFDESSGRLMRSITTPGGDVEQVPYDEYPY